MKTRLLTAASLLSLCLFVACGKEEAPKASEGQTTPAADANAMKAMDHAKSVAADASASANKEAPAAAAAASDTTKDLIAKAQPLVEQATTYIKDHKLELADKAVTQLEGMKTSLPADWASKVENLRKTLDAAKAADTIQKGIGGLKIGN